MRIKKLLSAFIAVAFIFTACHYTGPFEKDPRPGSSMPDSSQGANGAPVDTAGILKDSTDIPIGVGINSDSLLNSNLYASTVQREFDNITPQNAMKQLAIVQNGGSLNYSYTDQVVQAAHNMGLNVHGHTLVWYKGNNGTYLRSLVSGNGNSSANMFRNRAQTRRVHFLRVRTASNSSNENLVKNGGFESFSGSTPDNWTVLNNNNGSFSQATASSNVHGGSSALKVKVNSSSDAYQTQIQSNTFATTSGHDYKVTFWIKASTSGAQYQVEGRSSSTDYTGTKDTPTSYTQETYTFTADGPSSSIAFDLGTSAASMSYIDDVTIVDASNPSGGSGMSNQVPDNGSFENFDGSTPVGWTVVNSNNGSFSQATMSSNVHGGSSALKVSINSSSDNYQTQIQSPQFETTSGSTYKVTFWIKASVSGAQYQVEGRSGSATHYSGNQDTPTSYTQESYSFTADSATASITFDMGHSPGGSNTYIDDVKIVESSGGSGGGGGNTAAQDSAAVAGFMKKYITQTVSHFQGKVDGWDVINEPINGSGGLRTNPDPDTPTSGNTFYWDQYIGDQYIPMALKYAHQADPDVDLYINEYNLATNAQKLNGLMSLIDQLQSNNVPLDGIGTQLHININISHSEIDNMFQQLANTGLQIRISELDVRVNPNSDPGYTLTMADLIQQQRTYNYVIYSYLENVPQSRRADITVWNLIDNGSFIVTGDTIDYPTIFDKNYKKKPAYSGVMEGLLDMQPDY